jgi:hypothetical protein
MWKDDFLMYLALLCLAFVIFWSGVNIFLILTNKASWLLP